MRPSPRHRKDPQTPDQDQGLPVTNVAVLGGTGSVGMATVDVIAHLNHIDPQTRWHLYAASGHRNLAALAKIASEGHPPPRVVVLSDPGCAGEWPNSEATRGIDVRVGPEALADAAAEAEVDIVVAAIVGRAGLESTLAAVEAGKRVALANKETLVMAGPLVAAGLRRAGGELLPVDSEHSAIFQCLQGIDVDRAMNRLILTASGGPFRNWSSRRMTEATVEQALNHPTWDMGAKITIDSATMMNKAFEIIEARWLFDVPADRIEVMVHPQSIVHSMVEMVDHSVLAQLSPPDMKLPIQYALTYPRRLPCPSPPLRRDQNYELSLEMADRERFPALDVGFEVATAGGTAGVVVNAANEAAVRLFLDGKIRFTEIVASCRDVLNHHTFESDPPLARLLELDQWARNEVIRWAESSGRKT